MLQQWITGIVVALAAVYALWYWMPAGLRRQLGRMQKSLGEKPGCGACGSCGGCPVEPRTGAVVGHGAQSQALWIKPGR